MKTNIDIICKNIREQKVINNMPHRAEDQDARYKLMAQGML